MIKEMSVEYDSLDSALLAAGWIRKGDFLVRFTNPRIGFKPEDGTLVVGWHEWPEKVYTLGQLIEIIGKI